MKIMSTYRIRQLSLGRRDTHRHARSGRAASSTVPTCSAATSASPTTGGGNTSAKLTEKDPLTGDKTSKSFGSRAAAATCARRDAATFHRCTRTNCSGCSASTRPARTRASRARPRMTWSACTFRRLSTPTRVRLPSTRRCTVSFPASTWTTCTPTPSPRSRRAGVGRN